jgi:hypothetical protein
MDSALKKINILSGKAKCSCQWTDEQDTVFLCGISLIVSPVKDNLTGKMHSEIMGSF